MRLIAKPKPGEYPAYTVKYHKWIPGDGKVLEHLQQNFYTIKDFFCHLPEKKMLYRYRLEKWSIKEILVHIIDDERIFSYRALRFARNEKMNLIGFDQDEYAKYSEADCRSLDSIFEEYETVRMATISLFNNLPEAAFDRMGKGTGDHNNATVRALAYHIAGHEWHHFNFIKENYL